jgi:hypothetical protein
VEPVDVSDVEVATWRMHSIWAIVPRGSSTDVPSLAVRVSAPVAASIETRVNLSATPCRTSEKIATTSARAPAPIRSSGSTK